MNCGTIRVSTGIPSSDPEIVEKTTISGLENNAKKNPENQLTFFFDSLTDEKMLFR